MPINNAAPKGVIFELSALHDYGYSQTNVLLIFFTREFVALQPLNRLFFFFLVTILITAMFDFQS